MSQRVRPTGIMRTLPYGNAGKVPLLNAYRNMMESLKNLNVEEDATVYIGFAQKPTLEVMHCYLIVEGHVVCRARLVDFVPGSFETAWSGETIRPNWWAVLTGPVDFPTEKIKQRGFQGFRYTQDLW